VVHTTKKQNFIFIQKYMKRNRCYATSIAYLQKTICKILLSASSKSHPNITIVLPTRGSTWNMYYNYYSFVIPLQAGFIVLLFNEFRSTIITGVGYFVLTLFVQVWTLTNRFKGQVYFYWPDGLYVVFVLHKFSELFIYIKENAMAIIYYYYNLRSFWKASKPSYQIIFGPHSL